MLLNDRTAFLEQFIAWAARNEARRVHFHFITRSAADRLFVTFRAGIGVEQRAQAVLGCENTIEHLLALLELNPLLPGEPQDRLTQTGLFVGSASTTKQTDEQHACQRFG